MVVHKILVELVRMAGTAGKRLAGSRHRRSGSVVMAPGTLDSVVPVVDKVRKYNFSTVVLEQYAHGHRLRPAALDIAENGYGQQERGSDDHRLCFLVETHCTSPSRDATVCCSASKLVMGDRISGNSGLPRP
ncbi:MAG: hypothetical protein AB7D39_21040 [Pseudodesulfovibrio sp.]|uniref:hypothetical protein n=1 Tax=Pseudodesulfovibrio sp. TaxID=2035812 RepID=UPI003D101BA8